MQKLAVILAFIAMSACSMADDAERTISVTGNGSASVEPDRATVSMSIVARHKSLASAQKQAADVTAKVLVLCDDLDIKRDRVDTTGSSIRPDYRWNREREEQELRGYIAERQIRVSVRDLDKLGKVVEGAVAAGVNQVSPPVLDSGKRRDMYRDALANAAEDARANARRLARTLDAKVGAVLQISDGSQAPTPRPQLRMAANMASDAESSETYNAADLSVRATVQVVFALED